MSVHVRSRRDALGSGVTGLLMMAYVVFVANDPMPRRQTAYWCKWSLQVRWSSAPVRYGDHFGSVSRLARSLSSYTTCSALAVSPGKTSLVLRLVACAPLIVTPSY